jgi:hypothetical protein
VTSEVDGRDVVQASLWCCQGQDKKMKEGGEAPGVDAEPAVTTDEV